MPLRWIPVVLALAWGLNWPAVKIILGTVPPFLARGIGLGGGVLVLFALAAWQGRDLRPRRADAIPILIGGGFTVSFNTANVNNGGADITEYLVVPVFDGARQTFTRDINDEGVFVVTDDPLPEDSEVHLLLTLPGRPQPLSLAGVVTHTVVPEDEDVPGMGIVFAEADAAAADLETLIDELERGFLSGELPDELLE